VKGGDKMEENLEKNVFAKMIDKVFETHPEKNLKAARITLCDEFIGILKEMKAAELEPYLLILISD